MRELGTRPWETEHQSTPHHYTVKADQLLGAGGVAHYFNKMLRKEARDLGEWDWHQDYGSYWLVHPQHRHTALACLVLPVDCLRAPPRPTNSPSSFSAAPQVF